MGADMITMSLLLNKDMVAKLDKGLAGCGLSVFKCI